MKPLKVYGITLFVKGKQCRCIVKAKSLLDASKKFNIPYRYMRIYGCATGNQEELEVATETPMARSLDGHEKWEVIASRVYH